MKLLYELGNTPIDFAVVKSIFSDYKSVHNKISELKKSGKLIRLKKGMYIVSPNVSGKLLSEELNANHLYGPSYVSMEFALRYYGLIPESVHRSINDYKTLKRVYKFTWNVSIYTMLKRVFLDWHKTRDKRTHFIHYSLSRKGTLRLNYSYSKS